jgi:hypothetical protein
MGRRRLPVLCACIGMWLRQQAPDPNPLFGGWGNNHAPPAAGGGQGTAPRRAWPQNSTPPPERLPL